MSNVTLIDILNSVRNKEFPEYNDLYYALRMMESLSTFRDMELRRAIEHPQRFTFEGLYESMFNREKQALSKNPKTWLGIDD